MGRHQGPRIRWCPGPPITRVSCGVMVGHCSRAIFSTVFTRDTSTVAICLVICVFHHCRVISVVYHTRGGNIAARRMLLCDVVNIRVCVVTPSEWNGGGWEWQATAQSWQATGRVTSQQLAVDLLSECDILLSGQYVCVLTSHIAQYPCCINITVHMLCNVSLLVGWQEGHPACRKLSGRVLAWLSVWSEVQTCIWPSWCHCHSLSLASVKSRLVLHFWYQLTQVVPDKGPLNGCVCVCNVKCHFIQHILAKASNALYTSVLW